MWTFPVGVIFMQNYDILLRPGIGGRAVKRRTANRGVGGSVSPTAVSKLRQFSLPHICLSFGRDTKSRWFLLPGVYAGGSKRSHTGGKCVTCSELTNSRWTCKGPVQYLGEREKRERPLNVNRRKGMQYQWYLTHFLLFFAATKFHVLRLVNDLFVIFNLSPRHFQMFF